MINLPSSNRTTGRVRRCLLISTIYRSKHIYMTSLLISLASNMLQEAGNKLGFVFTQTLPLKSGSDLKRADAAAITAVSSHGIVDICNSNDIGKIINIISDKSDWIDASITAFMIISSTIFDADRYILIFQQFITIFGMFFTQFILSYGQGILFMAFQWEFYFYLYRVRDHPESEFLNHLHYNSATYQSFG